MKKTSIRDDVKDLGISASSALLVMQGGSRQLISREIKKKYCKEVF